MSQTSPTETKPLSSWDDVLSWSAPPRDDSLNLPLQPRSTQPLPGTDLDKPFAQLRKSSLKRVPKTLVCHDMMGGYLEDRFDRGADDLQLPPYVFTHWAGVDVFVYFSHHFVTIPPRSWIHAAHANGVKILGTIITEWGEGKKLCDAFLASPEVTEAFVGTLTSIAEAYGFEGWLVNIENELAGDQVGKMVDFVRLLRDKSREVLGSDSEIIWYDSVIDSGELKWQNELNEKNRAFFDARDGIFLNYTWKIGQKTEDPKCEREFEPHNLRNSIDLLEKSGDAARIGDVYVGIDVFGRGCHGGGGFDCDLALAEVRKHNLSAAIFAPGWTYELPHRTRFANGFSEFLRREFAFWNRLRPHLYFRGPKTTYHEPREVSKGCWSAEEKGEEKEERSQHPVCLFKSGFSVGCGPAVTVEEHLPTSSRPPHGEDRLGSGEIPLIARSPGPDETGGGGGGDGGEVEVENFEKSAAKSPEKGGGGRMINATEENEEESSSSSPSSSSKKRWWLNLTRQEFQSSFLALNPTGNAGKSGEREEILAAEAKANEEDKGAELGKAQVEESNDAFELCPDFTSGNSGLCLALRGEDFADEAEVPIFVSDIPLVKGRELAFKLVINDGLKGSLGLLLKAGNKIVKLAPAKCDTACEMTVLEFAFCDDSMQNETTSSIDFIGVAVKDCSWIKITDFEITSVE